MRPLAAYPLYLAFNATSWAFQLMAFPMLSVYYLTAVGLNPFQLAVVGSVLQATVLLCEVPTGVLADAYSRRLSVIVGTLLTGLGFALEGAVPHFGAILLAQVVRGLGQTFTSGAITAWITDELGEAQAREALLRGAQAGQVGGLAGNLLSAALAAVYVGLPVLLGGLLLVGLSVFLILAMPEHGFRPAPPGERGSWLAAGLTLRDGLRLVRARPLLLCVVAAGLFWGLHGEGVDRFWEAHFLANFRFPPLEAFKPVVWFGVFNLGAMLMSMIAVEATTRRLRRGPPGGETGLLGLYTLSGLAVVVFGLAGDFALALAAFWAGVLFSAAVAPLTEIWLNQGLPSEVRATVLSLRAQVVALGQLGGGLLLGALATTISLRTAMVVAGLALGPALLLLSAARRAAGNWPAVRREGHERV